MSPLAPDMTDTPSTTPTRFKRDDDGLVVGMTYRYTPEGKIDWKGMLQSGDLYVKREFREKVVKEYGVALDALDLATVKDRYLCVTKGGIMRLAHLRGFRSVAYPYVHIGDGKAVAVCEIEFIGNFETEGFPIIASAMASATIRSVDHDFIPYLETFAENRAFARAVKMALNINILSDIEVGGEGKDRVKNTMEGDDDAPSSVPLGNEPYDVLALKCANPPAPLQPITFEDVKRAAMAYKDILIGDPATWTGFNATIAPTDAWTILGKIEEKAKAEQAAVKVKKK